MRIRSVLGALSIVLWLYRQYRKRTDSEAGKPEKKIKGLLSDVEDELNQGK